MIVFNEDNKSFDMFNNTVDSVITEVESYAKADEISGLKKLKDNFNMKVSDFFRENRKLNIGVVGQVKAGKSSFLNTLLFDGKDVLPKASTPKTATLTKMEYSDRNIIQIEYYSKDEWQVLEENAMVDLDDEIYTSAREVVEMVKDNGLDPTSYLEKGKEEIEFNSYEDLIANLNSYVGEDGKFTPIVKAVTLYLNNEDFRGLSIVDTPGLNDPIASRTIRTKEFIEVCDVVFFLSQSSSFLDKSDWILLSSQLPQKGVKRLVLIASKFDSGIRDVLRKQEEDDIFGEDDNTADNIPKACRIISKKLKKRAKTKIREFVEDLEQRGCSEELINVISQCEEPVTVSAMAYNMMRKDASQYSREEQNIYSALKQFSSDISADLNLLANFDAVHEIFNQVKENKEKILDKKSRSFVPTATEELKGQLRAYLEKAENRAELLGNNDRDQLLKQKDEISGQINKIKSDIGAIFGELNTKIESEKTKGIRELREAGKEYMSIRERTGSQTKTGSYKKRFLLFFKTTEYYTYEEHYSYCIASDAVENLSKYSLEAANQVEQVFVSAIDLEDIKRKLLKVVIDDMDMSSEKYDSSLVRLLVGEVVNSIEFPVFKIDISNETNKIIGEFSGELTSADKKNALLSALANAITKISNELSDKLSSKVNEYKQQMMKVGEDTEDRLLFDINSELEEIIKQYDDKNKEIESYKSYISILNDQLKKLA